MASVLFYTSLVRTTMKKYMVSKCTAHFSKLLQTTRTKKGPWENIQAAGKKCSSANKSGLRNPRNGLFPSPILSVGVSKAVARRSLLPMECTFTVSQKSCCLFYDDDNESFRFGPLFFFFSLLFMHDYFQGRQRTFR